MVKPGPGAGDPYAAEDKYAFHPFQPLCGNMHGMNYSSRFRRVGILIKSRIPPIGSQGETPGYLNLPPLIGQGPGISLGIRKFPNLHADSPGPIYQYGLLLNTYPPSNYLLSIFYLTEFRITTQSRSRWPSNHSRCLAERRNHPPFTMEPSLATKL